VTTLDFGDQVGFKRGNLKKTSSLRSFGGGSAHSSFREGGSNRFSLKKANSYTNNDSTGSAGSMRMAAKIAREETAVRVERWNTISIWVDSHMCRHMTATG